MTGSAMQHHVLVIGAGPAGLTAALEATRLGARPLVIEKESFVGGIAATRSYKGFLVDMGGHRFFTRIGWVDEWWRDLLGADFIRRPRLSRIFYNGKFFSYPPAFPNAMNGLGLAEGARIGASYLRAQLFPRRPIVSFADWVSNNFGERLFEIFFKAYTEKVWGISCDELRAEWAAQRIKNMSLRTLLTSMIMGARRNVTSLIEEFDYPRQGPGMMWRRAAERVAEAGGAVLTEATLQRLERRGARVIAAEIATPEGPRRIEVEKFISSAPLPELVRALDPAPPQEVMDAADQLKFRDFLIVCLIVDQAQMFPDNWIYVHSPDVEVARIQNFKNWSPDMTPDPSKTSLGMEYFCNSGDALWTTPDADLVAKAARELSEVGLVPSPDLVVDGCVFRVPKAYPVYDSGYAEALALLKDYIDSFENLRTVGRNGLHRYNNQDHSMAAGRMAARQLLAGDGGDLWSINTEQTYHEERAPERELA